MIESIAIIGAAMFGIWAGRRHKPTPSRQGVSLNVQSNLHYLTELNEDLEKVRGVKAAVMLAWDYGRTFSIQEKDGMNVKSEFEFIVKPHEEITRLLYMICGLHEQKLIREIRHTLEHIEGFGGIERSTIIDGGIYEKPGFVPHTWKKELK